LRGGHFGLGGDQVQQGLAEIILASWIVKHARELSVVQLRPHPQIGQVTAGQRAGLGWIGES
jgi:epoxyqueuosine reductase QueG